MGRTSIATASKAPRDTLTFHGMARPKRRIFESFDSNVYDLYRHADGFSIELKLGNIIDFSGKAYSLVHACLCDLFDSGVMRAGQILFTWRCLEMHVYAQMPLVRDLEF